MAVITMTFAKNINSSVQVGDMVYMCDVTSATGAVASPVELGTCTAVSGKTLSCNIPTGSARPAAKDFIMFSKDNKVNLSSLLGYYSLAKFRNNSTEKAELFSIGADFVESSK